MRRLVAVGSIAGAPGATTTALALAAVWPLEVDGGVRPVLVEADACGGDLMVRCGLPPTPSLLDVAATVGNPYPGSLLGAASELPYGVRAVAAVPGRGPCGQAVRILASEAGRGVLRGEAGDWGTVLLDVGRVGADVDPLLEAADAVVLVTRGGAEALTHVSAYGIGAASYGQRVTLAVVGSSPYCEEDMRQALGLERVAFLPWDVKAVAAMTGAQRGGWRRASLRRRPLMAAAGALARRLAPTPAAARTGSGPSHAGVVHVLNGEGRES